MGTLCVREGERSKTGELNYPQPWESACKDVHRKFCGPRVRPVGHVLLRLGGIFMPQQSNIVTHWLCVPPLEVQ